MRNGVAYLRRSTDKQEQSLDDQRAAIVQWSTDNNVRILREYVDDAVSGTSVNGRQRFIAMIEDARNRRDFDCVVVWNSDRFSRGDVDETGHFRYLLREAGVTVFSVTEDFVCKGGIEGDILRTVTQFQNRQKSVKLGQDTLRGQLGAMERGQCPGGYPPYGYDKAVYSPDGKLIHVVRWMQHGLRVVMDKAGSVLAEYPEGMQLQKPAKGCITKLVKSEPARCEVVKRIFSEYVGGHGHVGIADMLNTEGITAPRGDSWAGSAIRAILKNPVYVGDCVWNRTTRAKFYKLSGGRPVQTENEVYGCKPVEKSRQAPKDWIVRKDVWPAIISRELYESAQATMSRRYKTKCAVTKRHGKSYLLSGLVRCQACGSKWWSDKRVKKKGKAIFRYYKCGGRSSRGHAKCSHHGLIRADGIEGLEKWILDQVCDCVMGDSASVKEAIDKFVAAVTSKPRQDTTAQTESELSEVNRTIAAIVANLDPENIRLVDSKLSELRRRKDYLEEKLHRSKSQEETMDPKRVRKQAEAWFASIAEVLKSKKDTKEARRLVHTYVDSVVMDPVSKTGRLVLKKGAYVCWMDGRKNRCSAGAGGGARAVHRAAKQAENGGIEILFEYGRGRIRRLAA